MIHPGAPVWDWSFFVAPHVLRLACAEMVLAAVKALSELYYIVGIRYTILIETHRLRFDLAGDSKPAS